MIAITSEPCNNGRSENQNHTSFEGKIQIRYFQLWLTFKWNMNGRYETKNKREVLNQ